MGHYRGFIFATVSANAPSFDEYLHPRARRAIDNVLDRSPDGTISATAGIHKYGYNGNWKLQLENSVDAYHLNYLHRSFFRIQTARTGVRNTDIGAGDSLARVRSLGGGHVAWDFSPMKRAGENALADSRRSSWQQKYVDDLVARNGPDRTIELMDAGQGHVLIFPNLVILATQIRTITPVAVDRTEVFIYPFTFDGAPEEMNRARLKGHEAFYGPAGSGATDDLEVFERQTVGFRAAVDPWILISRGLARERQDNDGAISSQITDELSNRAILHHWRTLMSARGNEDGDAAAGGR